MRTTITIDDDLYARAVDLTGIEDTSALFSESLKAIIQRESAHRLAQLGGTEGELTNIRRRSPSTSKTT